MQPENAKPVLQFVERNSIARLQSLADELNAESNDLNQIITTVSDKLAALNLGVEVWYNGDKPEDALGPFDVQLGFARIPDTKRWALATRTRILDHTPGEPRWEIRALIKAPREVRVAGLETIDAIVNLIQEKARDRLESIRKAKRLAAQI